MFQAQFYSKDVTLDNFEEGADPSNTRSMSYSDCFTRDTLPELIDEIAIYFDVERSAITTYSDEVGRIQVSTLECNDSSKPSEACLAKWKLGKEQLWIADYTGNVTKLEPVDLGDVLESL